MKSSDFQYAVSVKITLTEAEIDKLLELSAAHYDGYCKSQSRPGGIFYGWKNAMAIGAGDHIYATFHSLDTAAKCCELEPPSDLSRSIHEAIRRINAESNRLNN